jgi:glucose-1-phosphatase
MPPKQRLRLVLDLGGVIVDHDNAKCFDRLLALLKDPPTRDALALFVGATGVGNGSVDANRLFELMRQRYGSDASSQQFLAAWTCHFSLKQDVFQLLESMKDKNPIVLCSNTNAAHWDFLNDLYGLDQLAAKAILSHECGYEKPNKEIYLLAAAAHGCAPNQCLFVDDLAVNVDAAKALGFRTLQFTSFAAFRDLLSNEV